MFFDIFPVLIGPNGKEGHDDDDNAKITAIPVSVFDNLVKSYHGNAHGNDHAEAGYNSPAGNRFSDSR